MQKDWNGHLKNWRHTGSLQAHGNMGNAESMSSCRLAASEPLVNSEIKGLSRFLVLCLRNIVDGRGGSAHCLGEVSISPTVQEHSTWQPDHNDRCIAEAVSPKKPWKGLENYRSI